MSLGTGVFIHQPYR